METSQKTQNTQNTQKSQKSKTRKSMKMTKDISLFQEIAQRYQTKSEFSLYQSDLELELIEDESDLEIFDIINDLHEDQEFFSFDGDSSVVIDNIASSFVLHIPECIFKE